MIARTRWLLTMPNSAEVSGPFWGAATRMNAVMRAMETFSKVILVLEALAGLVFYDVVATMGYVRTYAVVRRWPTFKWRRRALDPTPRICAAVDEACVWYPKRVRCLQRSVVVTYLLRWHGVRAELVIGHRRLPLESHAWVEVAGQVVNDRPQYQKFYTVLDRV